MAIAGSPKKIAEDVAGGYFSFNQSNLRQYTPVDIKTILSNLALVARTERAEQVPLEDIMALKAKNMRLSRLNQAEVIIRAFCRKRRIPI